jgi:hypothetical protein
MVSNNGSGASLPNWLLPSPLSQNGFLPQPQAAPPWAVVSQYVNIPTPSPISFNSHFGYLGGNRPTPAMPTSPMGIGNQGGNLLQAMMLMMLALCAYLHNQKPVTEENQPLGTPEPYPLPEETPEPYPLPEETPVEEPEPEGPEGVGAGYKGKVWGDPHFVSLKDGKNYDIQPPPGTKVYVFGDRDIQINGHVEAWRGDPKATVFTQIGMKIGADRILVDINEGAPKLNGEAMEAGKAYTLAAGSARWDQAGRKIVFEDREYQGEVLIRNAYLDVHVGVGERGYLTDNVAPEGLLGGSAVRDIVGRVDPFTGKGALGDYSLEDFYVNDLFGDPRNAELKRFDAKRFVKDLIGRLIGTLTGS